MEENFNESVNYNVSPSTDMILIYDGEIFDATERAAMKIFSWPLVFTLIFSVLGFTGNSIVLYIYWRKWKKNKTRVFILTLGMLDWINCVFNMPVEIAVLWHPLSFDLHYLCKISRGCTYIINNTGSLVLVSIAIERYILVYYPLKNRSLTPKFAKVMCLLAFVIATVFSWPSFVFYGSHTLSIPIKEGVKVVGKTCLIADEHDFRTGLLLIFTTILFTLLVLVFVILTALYIAIGRKIYIATCTDITSDRKNTTERLFRKSIFSALTGTTKPSDQKRLSKSRNSLGANSKTNISASVPLQECDESLFADHSTESPKLSICDNEAVMFRIRGRTSRTFSSMNTHATRKNTVMMRMVTIAFMISFTPFLCILIIRYSNPNYYFELTNAGKTVYHVFLRTYFINSMVNPFIYGFMNMQFRKMVKDLFTNIFCSKCCRRRNDPYSL